MYDTTATNNSYTCVRTITRPPMYDITTIRHSQMQNTSVTQYASMHNTIALPHPHLWRHKRYTWHMYDTTHHPRLFDTTVSHHPHLCDTTVTHRPCLYDTTVICPHPHAQCNRHTISYMSYTPCTHVCLNCSTCIIHTCTINRLASAHVWYKHCTSTAVQVKTVVHRPCVHDTFSTHPHLCNTTVIYTVTQYVFTVTYPYVFTERILWFHIYVCKMQTLCSHTCTTEPLGLQTHTCTHLQTFRRIIIVIIHLARVAVSFTL